MVAHVLPGLQPAGQRGGVDVGGHVVNRHQVVSAGGRAEGERLAGGGVGAVQQIVVGGPFPPLEHPGRPGGAGHLDDVAGVMRTEGRGGGDQRLGDDAPGTAEAAHLGPLVAVQLGDAQLRPGFLRLVQRQEGHQPSLGNLVEHLAPGRQPEGLRPVEAAPGESVGHEQEVALGALGPLLGVGPVGGEQVVALLQHAGHVPLVDRLPVLGHELAPVGLDLLHPLAVPPQAHVARGAPHHPQGGPPALVDPDPVAGLLPGTHGLLDPAALLQPHRLPVDLLEGPGLYPYLALALLGRLHAQLVDPRVQQQIQLAVALAHLPRPRKGPAQVIDYLAPAPLGALGGDPVHSRLFYGDYRGLLALRRDAIRID